MVLRWAVTALAMLVIAGCSAGPVATKSGPQTLQGEVDALALAIAELGPQVDTAEAARAAHIAIHYSRQLARDYNVTDPPIIHNAKVNSGLRERGLCNDYTEDLWLRLSREQFATLDLHWSISPPTFWRIIHHSVIISARGDTLQDGLLLDPWRKGGVLYWGRPQDDPRYDWHEKAVVEQQILSAKRR